MTTTVTRTPTRIAILVLSDPNGGEEALGRLFNALAAAHELLAAGDDVVLRFQGAGTRWLDLVTRPDHPAHALFQEVRDAVEGASCACATVFGAAEGVERAGFPLLKDAPLPGTAGIPSLRRLLDEGRTVLTF